MGTFFWPYLLISKPEMRVLGVQIYKLRTSTYSIDYQLLGLLFAMLPQIIIFALFQKRIMGGVNVGAVKG
jgi:ABC-type glycerol-3-phosphate transport system permease component